MDEALEEYLLEHYLYEISMLSNSYNIYNYFQTAKHMDPQSIFISAFCNATLESFLMHCRCLIEFFRADEYLKYMRSGKFDLNRVDRDCVAQHYIGDWAKIRGSIKLKTDITIDRFDEISRQASHLSRKRQANHKWPHFDMYPDVMKFHQEFIKNLSEDLQQKVRQKSGCM